MWIWIGIIVGSIALDQLTKWLAVACLMGEESFVLIPSVFRFTYVENNGAAFGMLSEHRWVFMVISTVAIAGLFVYLLKFSPDSPWVKVALSLIIGGGIGNMIDRVALGYVIDFLDFCAFPNLWPWVFNVADACVCVGGGIIFVWCVVTLIAEARANRAKKNGDSSSDGESL